MAGALWYGKPPLPRFFARLDTLDSLSQSLPSLPVYSTKWGCDNATVQPQKAEPSCVSFEAGGSGVKKEIRGWLRSSQYAFGTNSAPARKQGFTTLARNGRQAKLQCRILTFSFKPQHSPVKAIKARSTILFFPNIGLETSIQRRLSELIYRFVLPIALKAIYLPPLFE